MTHDEIECAVLGAVREVLALSGAADTAISPSTSLTSTIGLDSMRFVDLTVSLEDALGVPEFPMQAWVDAELGRPPDSRFHVSSLICACIRLLEEET